MRVRLIFIFLLILSIYSCNSIKDKRIRVDDVFAEGKISKDTIYDGLIKFYDTATKKLVQTINYKSGVADGDRIDYHLNGKIKALLHYENGKINGKTKIFDTSGNLLAAQNIYYDLRVGPSIEYKDKQVKQYYFYSFENETLLHISYDSIEGKTITQLNDTSFFFWHLDNYKTFESDSFKTDLFLYLPNPPKLNFKYSLCIVDEKYNIRQTIKEFVSENSWDVINIDYSTLEANESFAIRLTVDNEFDDNDESRVAYMFKKI